ncbi:unnamed protein product [Closterium sp. NIES-53]
MKEIKLAIDSGSAPAIVTAPPHPLALRWINYQREKEFMANKDLSLPAVHLFRAGSSFIYRGPFTARHVLQAAARGMAIQEDWLPIRRVGSWEELVRVGNGSRVVLALVERCGWYEEFFGDRARGGGEGKGERREGGEEQEGRREEKGDEEEREEEEGMEGRMGKDSRKEESRGEESRGGESRGKEGKGEESRGKGIVAVSSKGPVCEAGMGEGASSAPQEAPALMQCAVHQGKEEEELSEQGSEQSFKQGPEQGLEQGLGQGSERGVVRSNGEESSHEGVAATAEGPARGALNKLVSGVDDRPKGAGENRAGETQDEQLGEPLEEPSEEPSEEPPKDISEDHQLTESSEKNLKGEPQERLKDGASSSLSKSAALSGWVECGSEHARKELKRVVGELKAVVQGHALTPSQAVVVLVSEPLLVAQVLGKVDGREQVLGVVEEVSDAVRTEGGAASTAAAAAGGGAAGGAGNTSGSAAARTGRTARAAVGGELGELGWRLVAFVKRGRDIDGWDGESEGRGSGGEGKETESEDGREEGGEEGGLLERREGGMYLNQEVSGRRGEEGRDRKKDDKDDGDDAGDDAGDGGDGGVMMVRVSGKGEEEEDTQQLERQGSEQQQQQQQEEEGQQEGQNKQARWGKQKGRHEEKQQGQQQKRATHERQAEAQAEKVGRARGWFEYPWPAEPQQSGEALSVEDWMNSLPRPLVQEVRSCCLPALRKIW